MKTYKHMSPRDDAADAPHGNVFTRFALRSLARNRSRTLVSIAGIALACALITAIFTSVTTLMGGLLQATVQTEGNWQLEVHYLNEKKLEALKGDSRVEDILVQERYGFGIFDPEGFMDPYMALASWPQDAGNGLVLMPEVTDGKIPSAKREIMLPSSLKGLTMDELGGESDLVFPARDTGAQAASWKDGLEVGSQIGLQLGERYVQYADSEPRQRLAWDSSLVTSADEKTGERTALEWLDNLQQPMPFTVSGFYHDPQGNWFNNNAIVAFTAPGAGASLPVSERAAYLSTNLGSRADLNNLIAEYTGDSIFTFMGWGSSGPAKPYATAHDSLLRYQGMPDDRAIWGTLYSMAAILSAVVIVAGVSLIYNSFAIAVSERTRQFGLLSSIGASKKQLRRTVYIEALALAAVGIPLGIILGLLGTWVVFSLSGEGIGMLINSGVYDSTASFPLIVQPAVLGLAAGLSLLTVLASAAVPAARAGRASAIDAIRQNRDVRMARNERKHRSSRLDGLRTRLFGIPGLLAHRNLTRARSKGRVAVASLSVSVALLIITGMISGYLGYIGQIANKGAADIQVNGSRSLAQDETVQDALDEFSQIDRVLSGVEGVGRLGYRVDLMAYMEAQAGVVSDPSKRRVGEILEGDPTQVGGLDAQVGSDGTFYGAVNLAFVDNESWGKILEANGLDQTAFKDDGVIRGLGVNRIATNAEDSYALVNPFDGTGEACVYTRIKEYDDSTLMGFREDKRGKMSAVYETHAAQDSDIDSVEDLLDSYDYVPLEKAVSGRCEFEVAGVIEDPGDCVDYLDSFYPTVILPIDELPVMAKSATSAPSDEGEIGQMWAAPFDFSMVKETDASTAVLTTTFSYTASDAFAAEKTMEDTVYEQIDRGPWSFLYLNNIAQTTRQAYMMYRTIQLFIGSFTLITGAIAVANVFNTLSSSMMLRAREFAVLRSTGMDARAFRRMIALECASYAWRGLAIGVGLALLVGLLLFRSALISISGMPFVMPWGWIAASVAVVIGVLVISTVYALSKTRGGSVVEALRSDSF